MRPIYLSCDTWYWNWSLIAAGPGGAISDTGKIVSKLNTLHQAKCLEGFDLLRMPEGEKRKEALLKVIMVYNFLDCKKRIWDFIWKLFAESEARYLLKIKSILPKTNKLSYR